ncbi:MAG TPA: DUF4126 domain-containing protein [Chthoniobacterales bacterium]|nr:DUF4126 domain-containing protein [Chthoniobacterales bacterium]
MDQLKLLGIGLGLACLAGLNLYLTVFVTGLAIHFNWIALDPAYQSLALLGDPIILWISGTLYALEFFADKIPWVDSAWDTVHTIIRPIGGALLAIRVLGHTTPVFDIAIVLAAGGASLVTHSAKAATRLVANTSPEPFSNIGLSLLEDGIVIGGLALIHYNPALALGIFVLLLSIVIYFAPKIFRAVRVKIWLVWKKLNGPAGDAPEETLPSTLPTRYSSAFARENLLGETVAWAVPCICKRMRGVPANASGLLAGLNEEATKLLFFVRNGWRAKAQTLNIAGCVASREPKFLSENLIISGENGKGASAIFLFERGRGERVQQIADSINSRLANRQPANAGDPSSTTELV